MKPNEPFPSVPSLMRQYGIHPKKKFGQNFLVDESVYQKIVHQVVSDSASHVVEFGPGLGTLTMRIASQTTQNVIAVELDQGLQDPLENGLLKFSNVRVHWGDACAVRAEELLQEGESATVCGNLPYNVASQILLHLVSPVWNTRWQTGVFLVQKEMADRLMGKPNTKQIGVLSLLVRYWATVQRVCNVPPGAFIPAPKVVSTVIRLDRHREPDVDFQAFRKVVRGSFAERRKKLVNSLGQHFPKKDIESALSALELHPNVRAENLDVDDFVRLTRRLHA